MSGSETSRRVGEAWQQQGCQVFLRPAANRAGFLLVMLTGCFPSKLLEPPGRPVPPAAPSHQVQFGGQGLSLGESHAASVKPEEFLHKTVELLQAGRHRSAQLWVERYPDVALDTLRSGLAAASPAGQVVAGVQDQQCGRGAPGWQALLRDRAAHPQRYLAYEQARKQFWEKAQANLVKDALALRLPELASSQPLLAIDAWHLQGNALLLGNRPAEAAAAYRQGLELCGQAHPYAAVHLLLVESEALRRQGKYDQANALWLRAVEQAGQLLDGPRPVCDPILWERISYLRPIGMAWPQAVADRLGRIGQAGVRAAGLPADEALVWCGIGKMRLERGESQAALIAYKRAESMAAEAGWRGWLQIGQAQALLQLNQQPSAIAVLAPLTSQSAGPLAAAALALVGAARYHGGSATQAVGFLERALHLAGDWPGRAEAEADLGLVYLTLGKEAAGLELLHGAQKRFASAGKFLALRQSLLNEREYWTRRQRPEEAARIDQQLTQLEAE